MSFWSWNLNDILVLITWIVFVAVVFSSVFMYILKPLQKKTPVSDTIHRGPSGDVENNRNENLRSASESKSRSTSNKMGKSAEEEDSESTALLAGSKVRNSTTSLSKSSESNAPRTTRQLKSPQTPSTSVATKPPDHALVENLRNVLSLGMAITMHTVDGPRQIRLFIVGNDLQWKPLTMFSRKTYKLSLRDVISIEVGKKSSVFKRPSASTIDEDHCLSILTATHTLDLETATAVERNVLAEGFANILQELIR